MCFCGFKVNIKKMKSWRVHEAGMKKKWWLYWLHWTLTAMLVMGGR